ncbi:fungal-specific transcription factor domain-containing protein [Aspergillus pseudodeflectus]|uniref:Fungal-specific transcription factor domain-containing protein n=1 Tax=Aspergillus pseudodeflectus TaxID=176178 RepID=A0ABR4K474_9EURO
MPQGAATKRPARQQPGLACEECRRRKARCDRAQPQCGACMMTGRVCIVNHNRHRRGPKKGQLKALYSRLEVLEEQLVEQVENLPANTGPIQESHTRTSSSSQASLPDEDHDAPHELPSSSSFETDPILSSPTRDRHRPSTFHPIEPIPFHPPIPARLDVVHADLDQLYFDRVHPIAPFLHQRRYFTWVSYETPSLARSCLRSAMRTIAAAMSAQFRSLSEILYAETRSILARLDGTERSPRSPSLEQIQALLLLAHYELLRIDEGTAMVTAGRCFRLIQLARLGEADAIAGEGVPGQMAAVGRSGTGWNEAFVVAEERKRTFWVAYCFDRFLSSRREWPLTLQEDAIRTRLPYSEQTFQATPLPFLTPSHPGLQASPHTQTPSQPPTLHEAITSSGHTTLPPFSECIVLATLYGRAMTLQCMASVLPSSETSVFWSRHKLLSTSVEKRTQLLARNLASPNTLVDPMVAFTHVLARATVVYLGEVADVAGGAGTGTGTGVGGGMGTTGGAGAEWSAYGPGTRDIPGSGVGSEGSAAVSSAQRLTAAAYMQRAFQAAREVIRLVQGMRPAHPFLPNPISRAADFLISHSRLTEWEWGRSTNETRREVDELLGVLRDLRATNNLAKELLGEMEGAQARIQTTVGMANGLGTGVRNNQRGETAYRHGRSHSENMRGGIS